MVPGGQGGCSRPFFLRGGKVASHGLNVKFSIGKGLHFEGEKGFMSTLHSLNPVQSDSDVIWISEGVCMLGVDFRLKTAAQRCRRGPCRCTVQVCSGVDKDVSASFQTKVVNSRDCTVGHKVPIALGGGLSGRHPAIRCLDVVVCCDNGLSHPNDVDPSCRAVECVYCLDFRVEFLLKTESGYLRDAEVT